MNRRRFLAMLGMAPVVAKLAPVVKALAPVKSSEFIYLINPKYIVPALPDEIFQCTPFFEYLRKSGRGVQGASLEN